MRGKTNHVLYRTWTNMIARCEIPGASKYKDYGGRGIKVCERWRHSFDNFVTDMGERPSRYSLDRIDCNGNYEPTNCKWSSASEQARNTRAARIVSIEGKQYHVAELQDKYGVNMRTIFYRTSLGWPFKKVISKERFYNNLESQKKAVKVHAEKKRAQTHCKNGHEFTTDNIYEYKPGYRACRKCRKAWDRFLYYKRTKPLSDFL